MMSESQKNMDETTPSKGSEIKQKKSHKKWIILSALVAIILIVVGIGFYSSYVQLDASVQNVRITNMEFKTLNTTTIIQIIGALYTGQLEPIVPALLNAIDSIQISIDLILVNNGLFPVIIPSFDFDGYINGQYIGNGSYDNQIVINSKANQTVSVDFNFRLDTIPNIAQSLLNNSGNATFSFDGKAHLSSFDIPIKISKNINVVDALKTMVLSKIGR